MRNTEKAERNTRKKEGEKVYGFVYVCVCVNSAAKLLLG